MAGSPSLFVYLSPEERQELLDLERHPRTPLATRRRIGVVLLSDDNREVKDIIKISRLSRATVYTLLKRFKLERLNALFDQPHPGRLAAFTDAMRDRVLEWVRSEDRGYNTAEITIELNTVFADKLARPLGRAAVYYHLRRMGLTWQRSRYVPGGTPDPVLAAETVELLDGLKRGRWTASSN